MDSEFAQRATNRQPPQKSGTISGAAVVTVCRAVAAHDGRPYLGELGFREAEAEHAPTMARLLLTQEDTLSLVRSAIGVGRLVGGIAERLTDPAQFQTLDALLETADRYVADHA